MSFDSVLLPIFITFYYYYTYFSMFFSWIIAPLLFYVILTQSKNLKQLKWLIFYYSFWSLFLTTYIGLLKPVFITPAVAGIQIGILKNYGTFTSTFVMTAFLVVLCCMCMAGLATTMTYRYLMVFPSILKEWFTLKKAIIFIFFLTTSAYILSSAVVIQIHKIPIEEAFEWGKEFDKNLIPYFEEKTFFIAPFCAIEALFKLTTFILYAAYFFGIFVTGFFLYQMKKYKTLLKSSINYSLLLSALVQGFVSVVFLMSPYTFIFTVFSFQIPYTSSLSVLVLALLSSHCCIDFVTTLLFITPYRKYLFKSLKIKQPKISIIAPASTTMLK